MSINDKIESPNEIEQFFKSLNEENENEYINYINIIY